MFSKSTLAAVATFLSATTLASPIARQAGDSAPTGSFVLAVTSLNSQKYVNATLEAAHSAASTENLVVLTGSSSFTFNETNGPYPAGFSPQGYLQYDAPFNGQPAGLEQQLVGYQNASSNVQAFQFGPEGSDLPPATFSFSSTGELFYGNAPEGEVTVFDDYFYICPVYVESDRFPTLSHVAGGAAPDNAECDEVKVHIFNSS